MTETISRGAQTNPFSWAEINARQQGYAAADANNRAATKEGALFSSEADRQNALVQPILAERTAEGVARAQQKYPSLGETTAARNATLAENAAAASAADDAGPNIAIPTDLYERNRVGMDLDTLYEPILGSFNNRGIQMYRQRTPQEVALIKGTPVPRGTSAVDAARAISGGTNPPAATTTPAVTAPPAAVTAPPATGSTQAPAAAFNPFRTNPDGTISYLDPDGTVRGTTAPRT